MSDTERLLGENLEAFRTEERPTVIGAKGERAPRKRLKVIDRSQVCWEAVDIEKLIEDDHPARGIWAMVNQLDMSRLEQKIRAVEGRAGQSSLDPRLLMALWIYGYSQGVSSARELCRMCGYERGCQWLTGKQGVNYHTLADFRGTHKDEMDGIFVQVLGLLSAEGWIEMKRITQDGTKIKAQASGNSFRREERIRQHLQLAREQVEALERAEAEGCSPRVVQARKRARREKQEHLQQALKELAQLQQSRKESEKPQVRASETDPEARVMKQPDGGFAPSYNVQICVDAAQGMVVAVDVTQAGNDCDQLVSGLERVEANMEQTPEQVLVDAGYTMKHTNIEAMAERGIDLIGPIPESNNVGSFKRRGIQPEFYPARFRYDEAADRFICPANKTLQRTRTRECDGGIDYMYRAAAVDCRGCPFQDQCCPKSSPRMVVRKQDSPAVAAFRAKMQTEPAKEIYRSRAQIAEFPHAWIKEKFGMRRFRLRGRKKVQAEAIWVCLTYNILQWLRLSWRQSLPAVA